MGAVPISDGLKDRVEGRTRAIVRAHMRDSRSCHDICIIDISTRGLLATTASPPKIGEFVEIMVGRNSMAAQVKWASARRFGLSLQDRVSVVGVMEGGDASVALARSPSGQAPRAGIFANLRNNAPALGRMIQFAAIAVVVVMAALAIARLSSNGLAPVTQAYSQINSGS